MNNVRSGRFTSTTPNFREIPKEGGPQKLASGKCRETYLTKGVKVRLLRDHVTLKAGQIGEVEAVGCWVGHVGAIIAFVFNDGDTRFSQNPENLRYLMEVVHEG